MSNLIRKTTELAMHIVSGYTFPGSIIIDATCGNGHDTLALAAAAPAKLYAFDIQRQAVEATRQRLIDKGFADSLISGAFSIICDSHSRMSEYVKEKANVIVFNLGYLPGGDKSLVTECIDTIEAVKASLDLLAKDGLVCITMYSGHEEGLKERDMLLTLSNKLDPKVYHAAYVSFPNQQNSPPEILLITKKS